MAKFISKILKNEKQIPEFFYDATIFIEKKLSTERTTMYDVITVNREDAKALFSEYRTDPECFRGKHVSIVVAALKIKCQEQKKDSILSDEDVSKIIKAQKKDLEKNSEKWLKAAKEILEKKPLAVLLLRHFRRELSSEKLLNEGIPESWEITEYLVHRDGRNEENANKVVTLLLNNINVDDGMKSLEPKGVPQVLIDFMAFIEEPENRETKWIYRPCGDSIRVDEVIYFYGIKGKQVLMDYPVPTVTSALKQLLKEEYLVDLYIVEALVNIQQNVKSKTEKVAKVREQLRKIPYFKLIILIYFINHLNRISTYFSSTEMNAFDLATHSMESLGLINQGYDLIWNELISDFIKEPDLYF